MRISLVILGAVMGTASVIALVVFMLATSQPPLTKQFVRLIPIQYADQELVSSISENGVLSTIELDALLCNIKANVEERFGQQSDEYASGSFMPICTISEAWPFEVTSIDYGVVFPFMADWLNEGKTVSIK